MAKAKGLGRGLDALFDDFQPVETQAPASSGDRPQTLPLHRIEPNRSQPRTDFDESALQELADSIAKHGMIQPITVRPLDGGYYQIVAGERRWRAARLAELSEVPVNIIEADDQKAMELALVENLQREDLNPIEEALGYRSLMQDCGLTQTAAAEEVGRSRPAVANSLRLLSLPDEVIEMVRNGTLSAGHARALLSLEDPEKQKSAAGLVKAKELSVRQTEALCRRLAAARRPKPEPDPLKVDYAAECEKELSRLLGRGIKIANGRKKGRIELEFYGQEDLLRLVDALQTLSPMEVPEHDKEAEG